MFSKSVISENVLKEYIENKRKVWDLFFTFLIFIGGFGFLSVSICCFLNLDSFLFISTKGIVFFPQGLVMSFYGLFGLILSIYQLSFIYFDVGCGYNEFNKETGLFTLFRKVYPGKNSKVEFIYSLKDILRCL